MQKDTPTEDREDLKHLGLEYEHSFKREMTFWGNLSLGFTYLSPVVAVYTLFAAALTASGGVMWWMLIVAGLGQLCVSLVFGEVVSNYPIAGGVYPWSRRLWGRKWGWMSGWVYLIALLGTIAGIAYSAGYYLGALLGVTLGHGMTTVLAVVLLLVATLLNLSGTKTLEVIARVGLACELAGAVVVGFFLLTFEHKQSLAVLFNSFGTFENGNWWMAFAGAALVGIFQYYGFEACGDVAEEVKNAGRVIPRAMRWTIYIGGAAAMFVCLALLMSVPSDVIGKLVAGTLSEDDAYADPVLGALGSFGPVGMRIVIAVVLISFMSCIVSMNAATSRLTFAMARDRLIPLHKVWAKFNEKRRVPTASLLLAGIFPAVLVIIAWVADTISGSAGSLTTLVAFGSIGIYIGFQMVVFAALRARAKGWKPQGKFKLGAWAWIVNILALVWGVLGIVILAWPNVGASGWTIIISCVIVIGIGWLYMGIAKPHLYGTAPAGDAIPGAVDPIIEEHEEIPILETVSEEILEEEEEYLHTFPELVLLEDADKDDDDKPKS